MKKKTVKIYLEIKSVNVLMVLYRSPGGTFITFYLSLITNDLLLTNYHLLLTTYGLINYHIIYHPYNGEKLHCTFPVITVEYGSQQQQQ